MYHDKKTTHNKLRFILAKNIGSVEIVDDVPELSVKAVLNKNH
jgi:3-dehydroquinate synthetase